MKNLQLAARYGLRLACTALACISWSIGWGLPSATETQRHVHQLHDLTLSTEHQLRALESQLADVRKPEVAQLLAQLDAQSQLLVPIIEQQRLDFEQLELTGAALRELAEGLDHMGDSLEPAHIEQLGVGLGEAATYLERLDLVATKLADGLERHSDDLEKQAAVLSTSLRSVPVDTQQIRDLRASLASFEAGLAGMESVLDFKAIPQLRRTSKSYRDRLNEVGNLLQGLSRKTYPSGLTVDGLTPKVEYTRIWPQGERIGDTLESTAETIDALDKELARIDQDLPKIRGAVGSSRRVVGSMGQSLDTTLDRMEGMEPLRHAGPSHRRQGAGYSRHGSHRTGRCPPRPRLRHFHSLSQPQPPSRLCGK